MNDTKIKSIDKIKAILPSSVINSLNRLDKSTLYSISELRLRTEGVCTVTINAETLVLTLTGLSNDTRQGYRITKDDLDSYIFKLAGGSVYSYEPTLKEGYITRFGIRTGICGTYSQISEGQRGFSSITSVNIRLPMHISGCSQKLFDYISNNGFPNNKGILVCSPPGVGKTTLLRDIACKLSQSCSICDKTEILQVCVIDERNEIYMPEVFNDSTADFLCGISKSKGIEIAQRVLSPDIIICDEIGDSKQADEILSASSGGVILIASAHGDNPEALYQKHHIRQLIDGGVFGAVCSLTRNASKVDICITNAEILSK